MLRRWVVERLGKNLRKELDFRVEAQNAARLAACMAGNSCVAVPQAVPEASLYLTAHAPCGIPEFLLLLTSLQQLYLSIWDELSSCEDHYLCRRVWEMSVLSHGRALAHSLTQTIT